MNKRYYVHFIFVFAVSLLILSTNDSYGQLLEDRNKLKTSTRKRQGFASNRNIKKSKAQGKPSVERARKPKITKSLAGANSSRKIKVKYSKPTRNTFKYAVRPRYSKNNTGQSGRQWKIQPRYSQSNAGQSGRQWKVSPRFSRENAGQSGRKWIVNPRYSQENAGQSGHKWKINPRYSQENAGQYGRKWIISPRYSQENAGQYGQKWKISPRYSQENAGKYGHKWVVNPRYSQENAGQYGQKWKINPRYSQENAGKTSKKWVVAPRYTQENAGQYGQKWIINPRYTQENAGQQFNPRTKIQPRYSRWDDAGKVIRVKPRYSVPPSYVKNAASDQKRGFLPTINLIPNKAKYKQGSESNFVGPKVKNNNRSSHDYANHNQNIKRYSKYTEGKTLRNSPRYAMTSHLGKMKTLRKKRDMHPSARYLSAKNDSRVIHDTKRKANIVWVRMLGNQTQPKAVKEKLSKAKFDKDEKDIWNN